MDSKGSYSLKPLELLELFASKDLHDQFCIVPFTNLIFNPNGDVGVCRQKGTKHVVGNIKNQKIEEIWNGPYLQKWRSEFLSGDIKVCKNEIARDACHLGADNYTFFPEITLDAFQKDAAIKFTANFNGQCNLRCKMCDIWQMENGLYDKIGFWEKAEKNIFPFVKEMELLSGEPFIQQDTYKLIDTVSELNPDCLWSFTTNGHWRLNSKIKGFLDKIRIRNIIISIDSLDVKRYSDIRLDGNLEVVLENLNLLNQYNKERLDNNLSSLGLTLHFLVMRDNWDELANVVDFAQRHNLRLILNNLYEPSEMALSTLDLSKKKVILDSWFKMSEEQIIKSMRSILSLISHLEPIDKAVYLDQLRGLPGFR